MWNDAIEYLIKEVQNEENSDSSIFADMNESTLIEILNEAPYYSIKIISEDSYIHLTSFWRAISENAIVFACDDKDQKFGREKPLNIKEEYDKYFKNHKLQKIEIKRPIHDLILYFQNNRKIEILADSCGYESWILFSKNKQIICLGGGDVAIF